ncbi:N-glycosylase/DNA lyase [candidate division WOR-3 bacterium]|nr:N-glycosylase/DNA lyase [candidate division WOR-3 bacterium]
MEVKYEIKELYRDVRPLIEKRLTEFRIMWEKGDDYAMFKEFIFCLLTPQSKAKICWDAVERMEKKSLLMNGDYREILECLEGVRFRNKKAEYIINSRAIFLENGIPRVKPIISRFKSPEEARDFLVKDVKGMGYKEASHFLRNIGCGKNLAILDRHILKNLKFLGKIKHIPQSISRRIYMELENIFLRTAEELDIPPAHLDLLLWFKESGEVFK